MPNDAEFEVRKQYNDVESDDMTYEAPLDREICLMGFIGLTTNKTGSLSRVGVKIPY